MCTEDDLLPLSALQHLLFCERQCALIHIEQMWNENLFTAEWRIMHKRVDEANRESRGDVRIEFGMPLRSLRLGLIAKADVVEFHRKPASQNVKSPEWVPFPVEYKRGKPKKDNCDEVQLCAQALCLEEMNVILPSLILVAALTEVANTEGIFRIIESIPLAKAKQESRKRLKEKVAT